MPRSTRHRPADDDWDDDGYDAYRDYDPNNRDTYPEGVYDDEGPPEVPCPYCREPIAEDSERCPRCGNYLTREDAPPGPRRSRFVTVMIVIALLAAAYWAIGG